MRILTLVAAVTMLAPDIAGAQTSPAGQPVALEIVATGGLDVKPGRVSMIISYKGEGDTRAEAQRAVAAKLAQLQAVLKAQKIPASALQDTALEDFADVMVNSVDGEDDGEAKAPEVSIPESKKLTVASVDAAEAVKAKLTEMADVRVGTMQIDPDEAGLAAAAPQAKALALRAARADADVYAKEMGMRVNRVVRISEGGHGLLLPGIQAKLEQTIQQGPKAMSRMLKRPDGATRVETSVIVEFELVK
jgi:uncharacterized protein